MKTLKFYSRIYLMIASQFIKSKMQYRADFFISSVGLLLGMVISLLTFWVLFQSIPSLKGWNYYQIMFIYGFSLLAFLPFDLFFENTWGLCYKIYDGSFIKYYFRPLNMMFYYMSESFGIKGFVNLIVGVFAIVYSSIKLNITWDIGSVSMCLISIFGSSLIFISIMILSACTAFWFIFGAPILLFTSKLKDFTKYPMSIFNKFFRVIFTFIIPMGFISFYPSQFFLTPDKSNILTYLSPVVGIVMFALAYMVWKKGIMSYSGTGS